jgi:hypothetical protein
MTLLHIEQFGDAHGRITVDEFWDCRCDSNYIHRKTETDTCPVCHQPSDESPDSMLNEVMVEIPLTREEREEAVNFLMERWW